MVFLNFGSLNLDNVYRVDEIVSPGETISSTQFELHYGGKGLNQSIALARAGAEVYHCGFFGKDGDVLARYLAECGVNTRFLEKADTISGHAIIQVDKRGQNSIIVYPGSNHCITEAYVDMVLSNFGEDTTVVLQNETSAISYIMEKAHEKGMKVCFNPSPFEAKLLELPLEYVTWLFINEIEGKYLTGGDTPEQICDRLFSRYPDSNILLTLGEMGGIYASGGEKLHYTAFPVKAVDTTGAGDTSTGFFMAEITRTPENPRIAAMLASAASAISVSRAGASTSIPTLLEAQAFVKLYTKESET